MFLINSLHRMPFQNLLSVYQLSQISWGIETNRKVFLSLEHRGFLFSSIFEAYSSISILLGLDFEAKPINDLRWIKLPRSKISSTTGPHHRAARAQTISNIERYKNNNLAIHYYFKLNSMSTRVEKMVTHTEQPTASSSSEPEASNPAGLSTITPPTVKIGPYQTNMLGQEIAVSSLFIITIPCLISTLLTISLVG